VTERTVALGMLRKTDADRVRIRGGFSLLDMKRYAETRGHAAEGYAGLSAGQLMRLAPAVVPIRSHGGDHFVVFRGVVRGQAVLADPAFGNRSVPYPVFAAHWKDGLAFVVGKAGRKGNRLLATSRDLLRVEDDEARRAMEGALPNPLSDAQLALVFGAEPLPPRALTPIAGESPPGAGLVPTPPRVDGAGAIPGGTGGIASGGGSSPGAISSMVPPQTSLIPSASIGSGSGSITAPALPPITVSLPPVSIAVPPVATITLPPASVSLPPLGR